MSIFRGRSPERGTGDARAKGGRNIKIIAHFMLAAETLAGISGCGGGCGGCPMSPRFANIPSLEERAERSAQPDARVLAPGVQKAFDIASKWETPGQVRAGLREFAGGLGGLMARGRASDITRLYNSLEDGIRDIERRNGSASFFSGLVAGMGRGPGADVKMAALFLALPSMANPAPSAQVLLTGEGRERDAVQAVEINDFLSELQRGGLGGVADARFARIVNLVRSSWLEPQPAGYREREAFFATLQAAYNGGMGAATPVKAKKAE